MVNEIQDFQHHHEHKSSWLSMSKRQEFEILLQETKEQEKAIQPFKTQLMFNLSLDTNTVFITKHILALFFICQF